MQVSKETDLEQLKNLGFNMYEDINIAKRKLYESISNGDRRDADVIMFNEVTSKNYHELKTLLRKNDYMQRCTNTNAKAAVLALLIFGEVRSKIIFEAKLSSSPSDGPKALAEKIIYYFTERKVYPDFQRVLMLSDIVEILSIFPKQFVSQNFYENMLDYLANMIFDFGI